MSEFEGLMPPSPGEIPNPEKLREMLEQHAYEAAKRFAMHGNKPHEDSWVNHGTVGDMQLKVLFEEPGDIAGHEEYDKHVIRVFWRPSREGLSEDEGWGDRFAIARTEDDNAILLYDHTRPGRAALAGEAKHPIFRRETAPGEMKTYQYQEASPEGVAYVDSLLTQLATR